MTKKPALNLILDFVFMCLLIVADQYTKAWAVVALKDKPAIPLISGILELNYLENRGAAFGMMQNQKIFFIFVAIVILGCIVYMLIKAPASKKYVILHVLLTFIAAGAIGNMIDRLSLNYVVDFIYVKAINFPIFNVADIYVTCATIILVLVLLFVYKDNDLRFLSFRTRGYRTFEDKNAASAIEQEAAETVEEKKAEPAAEADKKEDPVEETKPGETDQKSETATDTEPKSENE
ncbi:MAG: signal peptidase II [Lachnospiraceae bacterium]|nr:signal peptidase II [Lachnospiraceae bacterium]